MDVLQRRLKEYMEKNDINQSELARRIGITRQSVNRWIQGKASPKMELLEKAASVLGCSPADLIDDGNLDRELQTVWPQLSKESKSALLELAKRLQG